jgi:hypothetical protein
VKIYFGDARVFAAAHVPQIRRVFWRVAEGQHEPIFADLDALMASSLYTSAGSAQQDEWREVLERAALPSDRADDPTQPPRELHARVDVARKPVTTACRFPLEPHEAGDFAERPLRFLLENRRDWALFVAAIRVHSRSVAKRSFDHGWLEPFGCGGSGEVLNRVRERRALDRMFVFVDSDPQSPGTIEKIEAACAVAPFIPCRVAKKAELENYVPGALWRHFVWKEYRPEKPGRKASRPQKPEHRSLLEWESLTPDAKDQDDVKNRFRQFDTAARAVEALAESTAYTREDFLDRNGTELDDVLRELEQWL